MRASVRGAAKHGGCPAARPVRMRVRLWVLVYRSGVMRTFSSTGCRGAGWPEHREAEPCADLEAEQRIAPRPNLDALRGVVEPKGYSPFLQPFLMNDVRDLSPRKRSI